MADTIPDEFIVIGEKYIHIDNGGIWITLEKNFITNEIKMKTIVQYMDFPYTISEINMGKWVSSEDIHGIGEMFKEASAWTVDNIPPKRY